MNTKSVRLFICRPNENVVLIILRVFFSREALRFLKRVML